MYDTLESGEVKRIHGTPTDFPRVFLTCWHKNSHLHISRIFVSFASWLPICRGFPARSMGDYARTGGINTCYMGYARMKQSTWPPLLVAELRLGNEIEAGAIW